MRKATAIILGIVAPVALLSLMVVRRSHDKGNDSEHKTITSTALLLSLLWFLRDEEARASWGNRVAAGVVIAGAGSVWIPGAMEGLTNAGRNTARLFQSDDAQAQPAQRPLPDDADDRIALTGTGALDPLDKVIKAANKMPDGNKIVDIYLKSTGITASPEGDAVYTYEVQGPVGWYDDGAPRRVAIAQGLVRYNQDGSLEAGPFDWSDRLTEALDGGYARLTPIENAPSELVDGLVMMLADREFPMQLQADSAARAAARTSAEVTNATKLTDARAKRKMASEELASISPFLTGALKTPLGQDLNWWAMQDGHTWLQPLLMDFAKLGEMQAQTVVAALSPFVSHKNGMHFIPMVDMDDLDSPEIVDVTDVIDSVFSDDQINDICPECASARDADDDDAREVGAGNANKSLNNKIIAGTGFQRFTVIVQGFDGHADNWGMRFTIVDSNSRVVAQGKTLDSEYLPRIEWPGDLPVAATLNVISAPGVAMGDRSQMLNNLISKWLRKRGVTVNGTASLSSSVM